MSDNIRKPTLFQPAQVNALIAAILAHDVSFVRYYFAGSVSPQAFPRANPEAVQDFLRKNPRLAQHVENPILFAIHLYAQLPNNAISNDPDKNPLLILELLAENFIQVRKDFPKTKGPESTLAEVEVFTKIPNVRDSLGYKNVLSVFELGLNLAKTTSSPDRS